MTTELNDIRSFSIAFPDLSPSVNWANKSVSRTGWSEVGPPKGGWSSLESEPSNKLQQKTLLKNVSIILRTLKLTCNQSTPIKLGHGRSSRTAVGESCLVRTNTTVVKKYENNVKIKDQLLATVRKFCSWKSQRAHWVHRANPNFD